MGSVGSHRSELYHHINMKFLVAFSAIAAMAYAEADPYYAYGLGYAHHGYALGLKSAPCVNAANVPVPCAAGYAGHYIHAYGKRDAEAKAEADPYYGYGYHGLGYHGLGYAGLGYAGLGYHGLGYHAYGKREADADAEADAAVLYSGYGYPSYGYAGLGYAGLGYAGLGYAGLGYAHHGVVAAPAVVAAAPAVVAPVATVHNAVLGTAALPNPVHAVAHTGYGAVVPSSHIGVCTNYLGEQVSC